MALRIGGGAPKLPPAEEPIPEALPEEMPAEEPMPEEVPEEASEGEDMSIGMLDQTIAGYKGPDQGPFICGNCKHYGQQPNTCDIVSGFIDEQGLCNVFTPMSADQELPDEAPEEIPEALPEEAPLPEEEELSKEA